jgi:thiamine biosynthesis protein ThiS
VPIILVNGKERELESLGTVADLVASLELEAGQIAVERNREIVPRSTYADTRLEAGDQLEIVTFVGGG